MSAPNPAALILAYHRVCDSGFDPWRLCVSPARFAAQMEVLAASFRPVSLTTLCRELQEGSPVPGSVVVTFDDGYADLRHEALPRLERAGVPASIFLVSSQIGRGDGFWWDELAWIFLHPHRLPAALDLELAGGVPTSDLRVEPDYSWEEFDRHRSWRAWGEPDPTARHTAFKTLWSRLRELDGETRHEALGQLRAWSESAGGSRFPVDRSRHRALDGAELEALLRSDLVEIGAHTRTHPRLGALDPERQRNEVFEGKRELEDRIGARITTFSYPFGGAADYTEVTVDLVKGAGFVCACANHAGVVESGCDPMRLPRIAPGDLESADFESLLRRRFSAS